VSAEGPGPGIAAVTGATGYVGVNLVPHLLERGWRVRSIARRRPAAGTGPSGVEHVVADVRDGARMRDAVQGADVGPHLQRCGERLGHLIDPVFAAEVCVGVHRAVNVLEPAIEARGHPQLELGVEGVVPDRAGRPRPGPSGT
jgi:uncharacterized protein YbjT (DUF2867 family)